MVTAFASYTWTYDKNGNRTSEGVGGFVAPNYVISSSSNKIVSQPDWGATLTYTYDNAGNVLGNGKWTFAYDGRGRIKQTTVNATSQVISYATNGIGQRVQKIGPTWFVETGVVHFAYDSMGRLLGEYDANGTMLREFVYLGDFVAAVMQPGAGGATRYSYIYPSQIGTPVYATDETGLVQTSWEDGAFGYTPTLLYSQSGSSSPTPLNLKLRFLGQYRDSETILHHNYFRDYDPSTGRYMQPDPVGLKGGINLYSYAASNPVGLYDRYGLEYEPADPGVMWPALFGTMVHNEFYRAARDRGMSANVTNLAPGRPDAFNPATGDVFELKPASYESGWKYKKAKKQVEKYCGVDKQGRSYQPGHPRNFLGDEPYIMLRVVNLAKTYDVRVWGDRDPSTGLLFYDYSEVPSAGNTNEVLDAAKGIVPNALPGSVIILP